MASIDKTYTDSYSAMILNLDIMSIQKHGQALIIIIQ